MQYQDRITSSQEVLLGKPVIRGTRIAVEIILRKLSEGMSVEEISAAYPGLKREDIFACLSYSADVISKEEIIAG